MGRKTNMMVNGGRYRKNGTIILKDGQVITAQELMAAKKAGIPPQQLADYLKEQAEIRKIAQVLDEVSATEETLEPKTSKVRISGYIEPNNGWAKLSREEVMQYNKSIGKVTDKTPWYRKVLKFISKLG